MRLLRVIVIKIFKNQIVNRPTIEGVENAQAI